MAYDPENIFDPARRTKRFENDHALAFDDINPSRPVHVLVMKGEFVSMDDFSAHASDDQIVGFFRAVGEVARQCGVAESGYRIIANAGNDGHQEVSHFHVHLVGGAPAGPMLRRTQS